MVRDFRASQIQTTQIISSGSSSTNAKLVFYDVHGQSTASPNQGVIDTAKFGTSGIGYDIFTFFSGGIGQRGSSANSITVFGGDVHISGNLTFLSAAFSSSCCVPVSGGQPTADGQILVWNSGTLQYDATLPKSVSLAMDTPGYYTPIDGTFGGHLGGIDNQLGTMQGDISVLETQQSGSFIANTSNVAGSTITDALNTLQSEQTGSFVKNDSNVSGLTVSNALNTLQSQQSASFIVNNSNVVGATVGNALNTLQSEQTGSFVKNDSNVSGLTVSNALNTLASQFTGSYVKNDSNVSGITVANALNTLASQFTGSFVVNNSNVAGATITAAFNTLESEQSASFLTNDSIVAGSTIKDALNNLEYAKTGSFIINNSNVSGSTVTDALNTLLYPTIATITGTADTLANADHNKIILCQASAPTTVTVPSGLTLGVTTEYVQTAGQVTITGSGGLSLLYDTTTYQAKTANTGSSIVITITAVSSALIRGDMLLA